MSENEINFDAYRFRSIDRKVKRLEDQVAESSARLASLERDYAGLVQDRVRHEVILAAIQVSLDRINRRLELHDKGVPDEG
jgi:hypothetical protein